MATIEEVRRRVALATDDPWDLTPAEWRQVSRALLAVLDRMDICAEAPGGCAMGARFEAAILAAWEGKP